MGIDRSHSLAKVCKHLEMGVYVWLFAEIGVALGQWFFCCCFIDLCCCCCCCCCKHRFNRELNIPCVCRDHQEILGLAGPEEIQAQKESRESLEGKDFLEKRYLKFMHWYST